MKAVSKVSRMPVVLSDDVASKGERGNNYRAEGGTLDVFSSGGVNRVNPCFEIEGESVQRDAMKVHWIP